MAVLICIRILCFKQLDLILSTEKERFFSVTRGCCIATNIKCLGSDLNHEQGFAFDGKWSVAACTWNLNKFFFDFFSLIEIWGEKAGSPLAIDYSGPPEVVYFLSLSSPLCALLIALRGSSLRKPLSPRVVIDQFRTHIGESLRSKTQSGGESSKRPCYGLKKKTRRKIFCFTFLSFNTKVLLGPPWKDKSTTVMHIVKN